MITLTVTEWLWGVPYKVTEGGVGIDVDRNINTSFPIDGDRTRAKDFMIVSGIGSSFWEDLILQSFFNIPSVSAARLLKTANQQGIPIYTIDSNNISSILPQLQVSQEVINDIKNSVNAGKKVIISKTNIQYNDWNGVGYIILDPVRGSGAYMISGGLAGAEPSRPLPTSQRELDKLYVRICEQKRGIILDTAGRLIGTPYKFGCKDPEECGGIDCSGLVEYTYEKAGFESVVGKNAQGQYNATLPTNYPIYMDLVFFRGTYDKNEDCYINEDDGITHVGLAFPLGIVLPYGWMIAAQGKEVDFYLISEMKTLTERKASSVTCKEGITPPDITKACPRIKGCRYAYTSTGMIFEAFMGYRYAPEFDTCK
jgi:hypothetical protein